METLHRAAVETEERGHKYVDRVLRASDAVMVGLRRVMKAKEHGPEG